MENVKIRMPSFEGLGLEQNVEIALGSVVGATQRALDKLGKALKVDASNITVGGASKSLEDMLPWPGTLRLVYAKWAPMYQKRGWRICDGTNGTPQVHPHAVDGGLQRFLRACPWGVSPNDTPGGRRGGGQGHSHTVNTHDHDYAEPTDSTEAVSDTPSETTWCAYDAHGEAVATATHTHIVDHAHSQSGSTSSEAGSTDSQSDTDPYCEVIVMMYVG